MNPNDQTPQPNTTPDPQAYLPLSRPKPRFGAKAILGTAAALIVGGLIIAGAVRSEGRDEPRSAARVEDADFGELGGWVSEAYPLVSGIDFADSDLLGQIFRYDGTVDTAVQAEVIRQSEDTADDLYRAAEAMEDLDTPGSVAPLAEQIIDAFRSCGDAYSDAADVLGNPYEMTTRIDGVTAGFTTCADDMDAATDELNAAASRAGFSL